MSDSHGSDDATALLNIAGFIVRGCDEIDDEHVISVETSATIVGCPGCGTRAIGHGRSLVRVRDLPMGGRPVVIVWRKRRWRCPDADCDHRTWVEQHPAVRSRAVLTERARAHVCEQVGRQRRPVAALAAEFGIGWHAAMTAVIDHGGPLVEDRERIGATTVLGLDDHNFARGRHNRRARWSTIALDLDRGLVIDVFEGRDTAPVADWLDQQGPRWCQRVQLVTTDAHHGYRSAARGGAESPPRLPNAQLVTDPFHVVALLNDRVTRIRLRVQGQTLHRRGRQGDALYGIRRDLLVGYERLTSKAMTRITSALPVGDPDGHIAEAWSVKEQLRAIYALPASLAPLGFDRLLDRCQNSKVPELRSLVRVLKSWRHEILAHHTHRVTNARNEAANLTVELIIRTARGFRNYANYRLRVLLALGVHWQTHRTARIRTRQPRLIA